MVSQTRLLLKGLPIVISSEAPSRHEGDSSCSQEEEKVKTSFLVQALLAKALLVQALLLAIWGILGKLDSPIMLQG